MYCTLIDCFQHALDKKAWLSFDRDAHKIAPFCTKSELAASSSVPAVVNTVGNSGAAAQDKSDLNIGGVGGGGTAAKSSPVMIFPDDESWRRSLSAGDLVDVKDSQALWFQVRAMREF